MRGAQDVLDALKRLARNAENRAINFGRAGADSYTEQIVEVDAVDRGWYRDSPEARIAEVSSGMVKLVVDTRDDRVDYEGFVEFDTNQASGEQRKGRYPAKRGIERADFELVAYDIVNDSFVL